MSSRSLLTALTALTALAALGTAGAQTTTLKLIGPYNTFLTTSGTSTFPFKYYETTVSEVDKMWRDPVLVEVYSAIEAYVNEEGYASACMSRDLYYLKGTPAQLKTMQGQWIATLKKSPAFFRELGRSLGDRARDVDGAPVVLDTYLLKSTDAADEARSFTFITYPTKNKSWIMDCRSKLN